LRPYIPWQHSPEILGVKVKMNHVGGVKICNNFMLKECYWEQEHRRLNQIVFKELLDLDSKQNNFG
jgi:hypothetical protein